MPGSCISHSRVLIHSWMNWGKGAFCSRYFQKEGASNNSIEYLLFCPPTHRPHADGRSQHWTDRLMLSSAPSHLHPLSWSQTGKYVLWYCACESVQLYVDPYSAGGIPVMKLRQKKVSLNNLGIKTMHVHVHVCVHVYYACMWLEYVLACVHVAYLCMHWYGVLCKCIQNPCNLHLRSSFTKKSKYSDDSLSK